MKALIFSGRLSELVVKHEQLIIDAQRLQQTDHQVFKEKLEQAAFVRAQIEELKIAQYN